MHKIITMFVFLILIFATPVYAGSHYQYSRLIKTDNLIGYKSVVLDKTVFSHSNHLSDLRVINDKNDEIPYLLASIQDASTDTDKASFIRSEEADFSATQDGTDSVITIQVNQLNAFLLELNTDDITESTYGLFGVKEESAVYLSEGDLFSRRSSDSSVKKEIEWTNNLPLDQLRLIIHNRGGKPISLKSITIKYSLNKLVFKDPGNSQLWLAYGNDTLRTPIYKDLNYKEIFKGGSITETPLGAEVNATSNTDTPFPPSKFKLLTTSMIAVLVLLSGGLWVRMNKKKT